ncbi:MAG: hypothetical protein QOH86_1191, partial [Sphingomonadales bacterium]|nr:hypothetical protein [Sphingomonadales bacterium]
LAGYLEDRQLAQLRIQLELPEDRAAEAQERPEGRLGVGERLEDVQVREPVKRFANRLWDGCRVDRLNSRHPRMLPHGAGTGWT